MPLERTPTRKLEDKLGGALTWDVLVSTERQYLRGENRRNRRTRDDTQFGVYDLSAQEVPSYEETERAVGGQRGLYFIEPLYLHRVRLVRPEWACRIPQPLDRCHFDLVLTEPG